MTVYTKQWKAEHAAVSKAQKSKNSLSSSQAKLISKAKSYQSKMDDDAATIKKLNATIKGKKKKLTSAEQKKVKAAKINSASQTVKLANLTKSPSYMAAASKVSKAKASVSKATAKLNKYEAARHGQALKRVAAQTRQNYEQQMAPHASLHATNSMTGLTVFLFATAEDETNSSDITTYPIDKDDPVTDHVRTTGKTITITGYLYSQKAAARLWSGTKKDVSGAGLPQKTVAQQYSNLLKWKKQGTELVYKSNSTDDMQEHEMNRIYVKHVFISELDKQLDKPYSGMMAISLTLTYAYKAQVKTVSKPSKNNKGKTNAKGKNIGAKHITVKKGMTYWGLAQTYHTTVAQLRKWNGSEKVTMYPNKNGKYPKKLRVTAGKTVTASAIKKRS